MRCGLNVTLEYSATEISPGAAPGSDTHVRLQGALAGRYEVVREIGRGGMATVFLARDLKHARDVAVKVLHPELAASLGGDRFEREIRLAAKLQHPHILGLYDSGVAGELLYYVMPFVKGESLRDRLVRESMLPVDDAVRITLEVCSALGYAHAEGIVHRDIKPENILLAAGHALVADFGIARAIGELGSGGQKLTQTGMSVGTPVYMAPEQASGEAAGPTADIYSLGCVLYEMLAGEPPFTGPNPMAIMARHLMELVPSVRIVRSAVPEEIEAAIFAALGKLPVDRPQTAAQFAEIMGMPLGSTATMRAMRGTASRRVPSGAQFTIPAPAPARPHWRRPAVIGGAVAAVGLLVAGGMWASSNGSRSSVADDPLARRMAVLYFDDKSSDQSLRPVADGLTEGLIHSLGNATSLTVISRAGVDRYRGSLLGIDSIARALRAGYIVRGDVERDGSNVRVNLRLDDRSGANLKRATIAVPAGNTLLMRDSLAVMASALIRQEIGAEIDVREQRSDTRSEAAWLFVQRGLTAQRNALAAVGNAEPDAAAREFAAADSLFAAAEAQDASWVVPITQRATLAFRRSRSVGSDASLIRTWVTAGLAHADRAIALDPNSADALQMRGELRYWGWLNTLETDAAKRAVSLATAKADLEKATTLDSKQAAAFATLSHLLNNDPGSTINDVYIAAQRALDADEFLSNANVVLYRLFLAAYDLGQSDKADQFCATFRQRFPADPRAMRCQLYTLTQPRPTPPNIALAWQLADSLAAAEPPPTRERERLTGRMLVAAAIARASKTDASLADSARRVAQVSEGSAEVDGTREAAFRGAFAYTLLGDKADAVRLLTAYFAANPNRVASFAADPGWWFRDLQGDPQFQRLVRATP